jgi:hypothetical protein
MAFGVGCSRSESSIVPILSEKKEQPQQQTKGAIGRMNLTRLGLSQNKRKNPTMMKSLKS